MSILIIAEAIRDTEDKYEPVSEFAAHAGAVIVALKERGYVIVPKEPTDQMTASALEESLRIMKEHGVDGLSPFKDYPSPIETTRRVYRVMINT